MRELAEEAGIAGVPAGALVPYSRWITPEQIAIRFDTHFFVVAAPDGAQPRVDGAECVDLRWIAPAAAVAAYGRDELALVFPTFTHLQELAAFATVDALLAHARAPGREIRPILPRVVVEGDAPPHRAAGRARLLTTPPRAAGRPSRAARGRRPGSTSGRSPAAARPRASCARPRTSTGVRMRPAGPSSASAWCTTPSLMTSTAIRPARETRGAATSSR